MTHQLHRPGSRPSAGTPLAPRLSQDVADWATAIGVPITAAGVVVALYFGIRSDRRAEQTIVAEKDAADKASQRAENAARRSEEYTQRVVDWLERIAAGGLGVEARRRARWILSSYGYGDSRYFLHNDGDANARNVRVSAHESLPLSGQPTARVLQTEDGLVFSASRSLATSDSTITVTWDDEDSTRQEWKYPLPPEAPVS